MSARLVPINAVAEAEQAHLSAARRIGEHRLDCPFGPRIHCPKGQATWDAEEAAYAALVRATTEGEHGR